MAHVWAWRRDRSEGGTDIGLSATSLDILVRAAGLCNRFAQAIRLPVDPAGRRGFPASRVLVRHPSNACGSVVGRLVLQRDSQKDRGYTDNVGDRTRCRRQRHDRSCRGDGVETVAGGTSAGADSPPSSPAAVSQSARSMATDSRRLPRLSAGERCRIASRCVGWRFPLRKTSDPGATR